MVKLLLDKGADLTVATKDKWTSLHTASSEGHIEVAKLLLERNNVLAAESPLLDIWNEEKETSMKGNTVEKVISSLRMWVMSICSPPQTGFQRMSYICVSSLSNSDIIGRFNIP